MMTDLEDQLMEVSVQDDPGDPADEDVMCDVCVGGKQKAFKSCLTCVASYCEEHLQPHHESAELKRHRLVDPSKKLQENICSRHHEVMKMFCRTDQQCICILCSMEEHKGHHTVSAAAERTEKQKELKKSRANINKNIQDREKDLQLLEVQEETIIISAYKAVEHSRKMFTELINVLNSRRSELEKEVVSKHQTEVRAVRELQEQQKQEISKLKKRDADLQQISNTEDHVQFVLSYSSLSELSVSTHSPISHSHPQSDFQEVIEAVSEFKEHIYEVLMKEWTKVRRVLEPTSRAGLWKDSDSDSGSWKGKITPIRVFARDPSVQMMIPSHSLRSMQGTSFRESPLYWKTDLFQPLKMKIFTPEVETKSTRVTYRFRFPAAGFYHCRITRIRFVVDQEAELIYRMVQWDEGLLQSAGRKTPAGPLFHMECSENAIFNLQLPHCETEEGFQRSLSVAHISEDGMNVLKPLNVTENYVELNVSHLSAFGLLRDYIHWLTSRTIYGQVLLFLRTPHRGALKQGPPTLDVLLLPDNIPVPEVAAQQEDAVQLKVSSSCLLNTYKNYSVHCEPVIKIQPEVELFRERYGPNFHPMFEVFLTSDPEKVKLEVKNERLEEVWTRDVYLHQQVAGEDPSDRNTTVLDLRSMRLEFIRIVTKPTLDGLLDLLLQKQVITVEEMESARMVNRGEQARAVIDMVLRKGEEACAEFNSFIQREHQILYRQLVYAASLQF